MVVLTFILFILIMHGITLSAAFSDVHCTYLNINFVTNTCYSCDVINNLNVRTPNEKINSIHGVHLPSKYLNNVTGLSIINRNTDYLPVNLGEKFTALHTLRVKDGKLKKIDQIDLKSMPKLRFADFESNELKIIEKDLFKFNLQLEYVSFDGNRITSVGENVFENLAQLKFLDMMNTFCIKVKATDRRKVKGAIIEINNNCSNFTDEVQYYKWKIDQFKGMNSNLNTKFNYIAAKITINDENVKQVDNMMKEMKDQEAKNEQKFKNKVKDLTRTQTQLKFDISTLEQIITAKSSENRQIQENFNKMQQNITEIQQNIKHETEKIKQDEQKTKNLKQEIRQMTIDFYNYKLSKALLDEENEKLKMEYKALELDITSKDSSPTTEFLTCFVLIFPNIQRACSEK
ncbi:hypothetical protein ACKWTF_016607 [Chironomus riparius]